MAVPGFSINDLIDAAVQVKVVYDAFFNKNSNSATQLQDLIYEVSRFARHLERNREAFGRAGLEYEDYGAIYNTLYRCDEFLDKYKSVLSLKVSPELIWKTARFPYAKEYMQELRGELRAHRAELTDRCVLHIFDKTTTPNNGLVESRTEEVAATSRRRETINNPPNYPVSPTLDGLRIPNVPTSDSRIINSKYAYVTTPVSPSSKSLERAGFYHDSHTLSPHRPPSSYGPSPQNSPVLSTADTIRSSISPRSSPVPPPSSRLSSTASPQLSCPELILPQPALDYVVAEMWFGSKKIELRRKPAGRPSQNCPGRELVIINEKNEERLRHRIKLSPKQHCFPYTWNSGNHPALEVTFKGIPEGNHFMHFKGKPVDLGSAIPRYVFSNLTDFTDFQSAVRNKFFLGAFAINKIASETSGKYGDATDQHLKIWRDKDTRQCSISFYGSSLKRARDLEFPLKCIKKEPEKTKRSEELIFRFDPLPWNQMRIASPSLTRVRPSAASESEYTTARHNTFSTVNTVSTDRTTSTGLFNFSRQHTAASVATAATSIATITPSSRAPSFGSQNSDSGHSITSDRPTTSSLEELTKKMKFLKITFRDANEATRFHTAYKTALADTPSLPIDFQRVDWRGHPHHRNARFPSQSAPAAVKGGYAAAELEGSRARGSGEAFAVEMGGAGTYPAEVGEGGAFPVEMGEAGKFPVEMGGGGTYAVEMSGTNNYPVEMGEAGVYPVEMGGERKYPVEMGAGGGYTGRFSGELGGMPEETDFW
ncbi:hypothetical protein VE03_00180 [Pseudogymnoascus sp. 23342-1-I1]|nr:hypothetical protein VE03_00180 [Pseudogymnoascus sp. 23342-1-I1]